MITTRKRWRREEAMTRLMTDAVRGAPGGGGGKSG